MSTKNRALSNKQYFSLWSDLASGLSFLEASANYPISTHTIGALVRGKTYKPLFRTIAPAMVEAVQAMVKARTGQNNRAVKAAKIVINLESKKISNITTEMLTRRPWTTAALSA